MFLTNHSSEDLFNTTFSQICPHCGDSTYLALISTPQYDKLMKYQPEKTGMVYKCSSCSEPVFLKFYVYYGNLINGTIELDEDQAISIERPTIKFDFEYIPEMVQSDFKEALSCYSVGAFNAFAAMCRRTIQTTATVMGADGKSKVQNQVIDLKEIANIDEETFDIIKQVILDGHDGAHPHLPSLSEQRAEILLELIKDVMYQIFVRKGKLNKASELRKIQQGLKTNNTF